MHQRVAVLGASARRDSYANMALRRLHDGGHEVVPINPNVDSIDGLEVLDSLDEVSGRVDTLTMYVSASISAFLIDEIVRLKPGRVIFNPGSENAELGAALQREGIAFEHACTLVLLRSGQF
jgi:hypothetical protein